MLTILSFDLTWAEKLCYGGLKLDSRSGGCKLKREPREIRGRPRRCNRGRNLPDPLPEALSLSKGLGGKGQGGLKQKEDFRPSRKIRKPENLPECASQ